MRKVIKSIILGPKKKKTNDIDKYILVVSFDNSLHYTQLIHRGRFCKFLLGSLPFLATSPQVLAPCFSGDPCLVLNRSKNRNITAQQQQQDNGERGELQILLLLRMTTISTFREPLFARLSNVMHASFKLFYQRSHT